MTIKHLEVVHQLDMWAVMHNGEALATFATEAEAESSAKAIARTQPAGDSAKIVVLDDPSAADTATDPQ